MTRNTNPPSDLVYDQFETPIGSLMIAGDASGLRYVVFAQARYRPEAVAQWRHDAESLREPRQQLLAYFAGELTQFDLHLAVVGTDFQQRAWAALRKIPFGETRSYSEQASAIGSPRAVRAIGLANGRNPLPIIVPCHRVIGRDGSLTGFGGGLDCKRWLLAFEAGRRTGSG
ncbi:MAG: methylated-DNA--[protein]-cysteine S-methyltransferase [Pseudomarimonas sp.]